MRHFRLKATVTLEVHAGNARLRDVISSKVLALSRTEGQLLTMLGRNMSPTDIVLHVERHTTQLDQATVLALFTRLAAAGFLDTDAAPTPKPIPAPPHSPTEVVPCIRNDLDFAPGRKLGLVEVRDDKQGRSFTLYDFEANIARMLDGRRTIRQVAEAAENLGIETSPDALRNFFRQLKALGFLADKPVPIQPPRGRKPWLQEIREMYRHALRHSRKGELDQAAEYLEALLQVDPEVSEARDLLEQVQARQQGASSPGLDFQSLHGHRHYLESPEPAAPQAPNPFQRFEESGVKVAPAPAMRPTKRAPSPPSVAPTLAPPEADGPPVRPTSNSLPPLWTVSTVISNLTLPEVGDSVLAFDPQALLDKRAQEKPTRGEAPDDEVPWDLAANER
ncbi:MAG: hypothetical protein AMXMBFR34_22700 [Myxococcaceae bacterium]